MSATGRSAAPTVAAWRGWPWPLLLAACAAAEPTPTTVRRPGAAALTESVPMAAPPPAAPSAPTGPAPRTPSAPGGSTAAPPAPPPRASFVAVGDVLLSRQVAACIAARDDASAPFRNVAPLLARADFVFGNLESPFSRSSAFSVSSAQVFNTPPAYVAGLVQHRFRVVSLANNHALDQGVAGLRFTLEHLAKHHIATVGAGLDAAQAWQPAVVEVRGIRIGFTAASYASVNDDGSTRYPNVARLDDTERLRRALAQLRAEADVVVASMHAGSEYNPAVHPSQRRFARLAIDHGADLVLGAHPHVLQPVERYRGRFVFYSLGNFVFDHLRPGTRRGLAVRVTVALRPGPDGRRHGAITGLELHPVVVEDRCAPRPADATEAAAIVEALGPSAIELVREASSAPPRPADHRTARPTGGEPAE